MSDLKQHIALAMTVQARAARRRGEAGWPDIENHQQMQRLAHTALQVIISTYADWTRAAVREHIRDLMVETTDVGMRQMAVEHPELEKVAFLWRDIPKLPKIAFADWMSDAIAERIPMRAR